MIYKDISEQIEELRCKLHKELEKSGFDTKIQMIIIAYTKNI